MVLGEAILIGLVNAACNAIFDYVVDSAAHDGVEAGEDTDVVFGNFVSGTGTYSYTDSDGTVTTEQATWSIHSSSYENLFIVDSEHVKWHLAQISSSGSPTVGTYWSSGIVFNGGGRYVGVCTVDGAVTVPASSNISQVYFTNYSTGFANYGYQSGTGSARNGSAYPLNISDGTVTNYTDASNVFNNIITLPADSTTAYSYNDMRQMIQVYVSENYPEYTINVPTWQEISGEVETETTEQTGCCCDCTTIYVNADGSLTLNNDITGDMPINIDNNADLSLSVNAAAGAFGAGAIVIDPDANINIAAGAFGAGAFGAGAIVSPDIDISGEVSVSEVSISGGVSASEISFSGNSIIVDQSGSTITNNYYYDPSEPTEAFTIDYDEILSEGELESILTQETYEIIDIETVSEMYLPETIPGDVSALPGEVVVTSNNIVNTGSQIITDSGLMPVYAPLALFSVACYILRGLR